MDIACLGPLKVRQCMYGAFATDCPRGHRLALRPRHRSTSRPSPAVSALIALPRAPVTFGTRRPQALGTGSARRKQP
jgi:hypothetical protein